MSYASSVLLEAPNGDLILQHRDNKPNILYPDRVNCFGGHGELYETPITTAMREIEEETNLKLKFNDLEFLASVKMADCSKYIDEYMFVAKNIDFSLMTINEGQSELMSTQYSTIIGHHCDKLKYIKNDFDQSKFKKK
jgi:ADP-ribose pyrophosphatase YjhB (NUDIX family)